MDFTRREFARLIGSGAVLASAGSARALMQETGRRLNYCIVGLGRISLGQFMPGVKISNHAKVTALVSGHRNKALKVAAQYGVAEQNIYSYENYDSIASNKDIDAVYIALPNNMHADYTIRAAKAGKHVLCEKPMATSVEDCQAMIDACKQATKKLMIAYRCQYEPTNLRAIGMIRNGKLGTVQLIESTFGFNIKKGEWRLNKKMAGGGPLMDVGIYSLNACRYLTGEEPAAVSGYSSVIDHDGRFEQVEENLVWTLKFPSGILASCSTTYGANPGGWYQVNGSKGNVHLEPAFSYDGLRIRAEIQGQPPIDQTTNDPSPHQFQREADYFAQCVFENKQPKTSGEEGLRDMKLITEIYKSCGIA